MGNASALVEKALVWPNSFSEDNERPERPNQDTGVGKKEERNMAGQKALGLVLITQDSTTGSKHRELQDGK